MSALFEMAVRHRANKIRPEVCHYCDLYEQILPRRPARLLEIGVQTGNSIRLWREWLGPDAWLGGIDLGGIPDDCGLNWQYEGPQADPRTIAAAVSAGPWDYIIDDGSHAPMDQITTIQGLWPAVTRGGWYATEDCHTSYWPREGAGNFVSWAGNALHDLNMWARKDSRSNREWQRRPAELPALLRVTAVKGLIVFHKEP